jgi:hypothetical protein
MARAIGLVGHILEEFVQPMARQVWMDVEEQSSRHARPQPAERSLRSENRHGGGAQ